MLILPSAQLVLNAHLALTGSTPGNAVFNSHVAIASAPGGAAAWVNAVNGFVDATFGGTDGTARLADALVANLGLGAVEGIRDTAIAFLNSQPANRGGLAIDAANWLLTSSFAAADTALIAAQTAFRATNSAAFAFSSNPANATPISLATLRQPVPEAQDFTLSTGLDNIAGNALNNTFNAPLVDNGNTFQSGDVVNGGAGEDRLNITLGSSSAFAVRAETNAVENVFITSQARNRSGDRGHNEVYRNQNNGEDFADDVNFVDAELMSGVNQWWNTNSRADLVIEDVRSASAQTTIGLRNTDTGPVDYRVYFDNQWITDAGQARGLSTLVVRMVNAFELATNQAPAAGFDTITFRVGDQQVVANVQNLTTYPQVVTAINAALQAAGIQGVTVSLLPNEQAFFTAQIGNFQARDLAGNFSPILISSNTHTLTRGPIALSSDVVDFNGLNTMRDATGDEFPSLTQTNVVLDNVGRGSHAGVLEIGAMEQLQPVVGVERGIQQFNITVQRSSWLDEVRSTHNSLQALHIVNGALDATQPALPPRAQTLAAQGNLRIDNLEDVRLVEASAMTGNLHLNNVRLTDAIVAKYLELRDAQGNPAGDNSVSTVFSHGIPGTGNFARDFNYATGAGNDEINISISNTNLAVLGTATREDFVLNLNTGAGNDTVRLQIVDDLNNLAASSFQVGTNENWYTNHAINAGAGRNQLVINTGAGDDVVRTPGAGNVRILTGTGNDVVYTDNAGRQADDYFNEGRATWVLNAANQDIFNLQSQPAATVNAVNAQLQVSFMGYRSALTTIADSMDARANVAITDLHINQAIKQAINADPVLRHLFVAEDGPGRTLIVRSLIDGRMEAADLQIAFSSPVLTAAQSAVTPVPNQFATGLPGFTELLNGYMATPALDTARDLGAFAQQGGSNIIGADSTFESDNIVNAGEGFDVIVLGTDVADVHGGPAGTGSSNDTVVMDASFGHNVIVNFGGYGTDTTPGANGADVLDFAGTWGAAVVAPSTVPTGGNALAAGEVSIVGFDQLGIANATFANLTTLTLEQLNAAYNFGSNTGAAGTAESFLILVHDNNSVTAEDSSSTFRVFTVTSNASTHNATAVTFNGQVTLVGVEVNTLTHDASII